MTSLHTPGFDLTQSNNFTLFYLIFVFGAFRCISVLFGIWGKCISVYFGTSQCISFGLRLHFVALWYLRQLHFSTFGYISLYFGIYLCILAVFECVSVHIGIRATVSPCIEVYIGIFRYISALCATGFWMHFGNFRNILLLGANAFRLISVNLVHFGTFRWASECLRLYFSAFWY